MKVAQSCPILCDPMDYTVHGIFQARILDWVAFPFSRGIFPPQGWNPGLPHCRQILYQLSHKGSPCRKQCRRPGFNLWVGKIPWKREWLPTPVFWPGKSHGLYSPWGCKESDTTERLSFSLLLLHYSRLFTVLATRKAQINE